MARIRLSNDATPANYLRKYRNVPRGPTLFPDQVEGDSDFPLQNCLRVKARIGDWVLAVGNPLPLWHRKQRHCKSAAV